MSSYVEELIAEVERTIVSGRNALIASEIAFPIARRLLIGVVRVDFRYDKTGNEVEGITTLEDAPYWSIWAMGNCRIERAQNDIPRNAIPQTISELVSDARQATRSFEPLYGDGNGSDMFHAIEFSGELRRDNPELYAIPRVNAT